jgi:hypothetical protein
LHDDHWTAHTDEIGNDRKKTDIEKCCIDAPRVLDISYTIIAHRASLFHVREGPTNVTSFVALGCIHDVRSLNSTIFF